MNNFVIVFDFPVLFLLLFYLIFTPCHSHNLINFLLIQQFYFLGIYSSFQVSILTDKLPHVQICFCISKFVQRSTVCISKSLETTQVSVKINKRKSHLEWGQKTSRGRSHALTHVINCRSNSKRYTLHMNTALLSQEEEGFLLSQQKPNQ